MRRAAALLATLGCACAAHAPLDRGVSRGKPVPARIEDVPVCGATVTVGRLEGETVVGELLAVEDEGLALAVEGAMIRIPFSRMGEKVTVQVLPSRAGTAAVVTTLGSISALSHGVFLILSLPTWLGGGIGATVKTGREARAEADRQDPELARWARFPQGLPPGWPIDAARIERCDASPSNGPATRREAGAAKE